MRRSDLTRVNKLVGDLADHRQMRARLAAVQGCEGWSVRIDVPGSYASGGYSLSIESDEDQGVHAALLDLLDLKIRRTVEELRSLGLEDADG